MVLRYMQALDIPHDKINVNGGAIAMGHPLGATGAMILGTVLDELERRDLNTALVTLCIGAGMGTATIIERVVRRRMPKIDIDRRFRSTVRLAVIRPPVHKAELEGRSRTSGSADAVGLTQFGVNI